MLDTYILLGKLSPPHTQRVINEYAIYHRSASNPTSPKTLKDFLPLLDTKMSSVFDDPMQGVLISPFHQGLFEAKTLIDALELIYNLQADSHKELLMLYSKTYSKCRQYIMDMALSMAREIPSLTDAEIYSDEEFFSWWRGNCRQEIHIRVYEKDVITLYLPNLPEKSITMIAKVIQDIANDYGRLAYLLDRPSDAVKDFIQAFVIELNEGMINLPLNQYGKQRCPVAKELETSIKKSTGYPTIAPYVKQVSIAGQVLHDVFKRFFAVKYKSCLLPRTQKRIRVSQLGSCPFPDYGFMDRDSETEIRELRTNG